MVQEGTRSFKSGQDDIRRDKMVQGTRSYKKGQYRTRRDKIIQEGTRSFKS